MTEVEIGRAQVREAEAILKLQFLAFQSEAELHDNHRIAPLRETLAEVLAAYDEAEMLVARLDGEVVGAGRAVRDGDKCVIRLLAVHPRLRGHGIGTRLIRAAEAAFPGVVRFEIYASLRSPGNIRLYESLGYERVREEQIREGLRFVYLEKTAAYDRLGRTYAATRTADPRIAAQIHAALGDARSVANVGAGTGSYEPADRQVVAVEPSAAMLRQRPASAAPAIQAVAERLPMIDDAVDAAMAILTVHHWSDPRAGVAELRRVARDRVVILSWEPAAAQDFWLARDYIPAMAGLDLERFPPPDAIAGWLGAAEVQPVPVPADCSDGFAAAFWRRPAAYLDPAVRAGISTFHALPSAVVDAGLARLRDDLESGAWERRHADLLAADKLDLGYRLVVARGASG